MVRPGDRRCGVFGAGTSGATGCAASGAEASAVEAAEVEASEVEASEVEASGAEISAADVFAGTRRTRGVDTDGRVAELRRRAGAAAPAVEIVTPSADSAARTW